MKLEFFKIDLTEGFTIWPLWPAWLFGSVLLLAVLLIAISKIFDIVNRIRVKKLKKVGKFISEQTFYHDSLFLLQNIRDILGYNEPPNTASGFLGLLFEIVQHQQVADGNTNENCDKIIKAIGELNSLTEQFYKFTNIENSLNDIKQLTGALSYDYSNQCSITNERLNDVIIGLTGAIEAVNNLPDIFDKSTTIAVLNRFLDQTVNQVNRLEYSLSPLQVHIHGNPEFIRDKPSETTAKDNTIETITQVSEEIELIKLFNKLEVQEITIENWRKSIESGGYIISNLRKRNLPGKDTSFYEIEIDGTRFDSVVLVTKENTELFAIIPNHREQRHNKNIDDWYSDYKPNECLSINNLPLIEKESVGGYICADKGGLSSLKT